MKELFILLLISCFVIQQNFIQTQPVKEIHKTVKAQSAELGSQSVKVEPELELELELERLERIELRLKLEQKKRIKLNGLKLNEFELQRIEGTTNSDLELPKTVEEIKLELEQIKLELKEIEVEQLKRIEQRLKRIERLEDIERRILHLHGWLEELVQEELPQRYRQLKLIPEPNNTRLLGIFFQRFQNSLQKRVEEIDGLLLQTTGLGQRLLDNPPMQDISLDTTEVKKKIEHFQAWLEKRIITERIEQTKIAERIEGMNKQLKELQLQLLKVGRWLEGQLRRQLLWRGLWRGLRGLAIEFFHQLLY